MNPCARAIIVLITVLTLAAMPALCGAQGEDTFTEEKTSNGGLMAFDLVLVRPAGLLATAIGSAAFIIWLPFSAINKDTAYAAEKLVKEPAAYTFGRPLGFF